MNKNAGAALAELRAGLANKIQQLQSAYDAEMAKFMDLQRRIAEATKLGRGGAETALLELDLDVVQRDRRDIGEQISGALQELRDLDSPTIEEEYASAHRALTNKSAAVRVEYGRDQVPEWVRKVIDESLAIESEDAISAGSLGFMTRALVNATMPYKDPKSKVFERRNGDMTLTMLSPQGVPFGKYPRLLMSYLVTEAVAKRSNIIEMGNNLAEFLKTTMNVNATGGMQGTQTRLSEQMQRLFTSMVSVSQRQSDSARGFDFENITVVKRGTLDGGDLQRFDRVVGELWKQPDLTPDGKWNSRIELTTEFYNECVSTPVPMDLRAYKVLSEAPMAMDIYAWCTYRVSYVRRQTRPIPWPALQAQFGSGLPFTAQGLRDFKKAFLRNLAVVKIVYPALKIEETATGLIFMPSLTHIARQTQMKLL